MIPTRVVILSTHPVLERMIRSAAIVTGLDPIDTVAFEDLAAISVEPTVAVIDADPLDGSSLHALHLLHEVHPDARAIVLCDRIQGRQALEALRLGAWAIVPKQEGLHDLEVILARVSIGERLLQPELERAVVHELGRFARQARERSSLETAITRREC